jgi:hypothetical protein
MGRFHIKILGRNVEAFVDAAADAYGWLDQHAAHGERYQLTALTSSGAVPIEMDTYEAPDTSLRGRQRI